MGGSSPPPANTTSTVTNNLPDYLQPYMAGLAVRANSLSQRPYAPYKGQQVAGLNAQHQQALGKIQQTAMGPSYGMSAARNMNTNTLEGDYMRSAAQNKKGLMPVTAATNTKGMMPVTAATNSAATRNAMAGVNNPYLNQVINNSNADIIKGFQRNQMPQTDAAAARAGAFGGSAWKDLQVENNRALTDELAKNTSNLRMGDYDTQRQMEEARVGRGLQLGEANANRLQDVNQAQANRFLQLGEAQAGRTQEANQAQANRFLQLGEAQAGRDQQTFQTERDRQQQAIANELTFKNQGYADAQKLLGAGDINRDLAQTSLNNQYQNYLNQQNWPLQNLDILQNMIRTSMGAGGSSTTTGNMARINPTSNMIGGAMGGYALGDMLSGGSKYGGYGGAAAGALAGLFG